MAINIFQPSLPQEISHKSLSAQDPDGHISLFLCVCEWLCIYDIHVYFYLLLALEYTATPLSHPQNQQSTEAEFLTLNNEE